MQILTFDGKDEGLKHQMARLLVDAFREHWADAWETFEDGLAEVEEMCEAERICLVAAGDGKLLGMIGGIPEYDGKVWELHPLAVLPAFHGRGIGRALVLDFEEQVRRRGGLTVMLGTDDQDGMTSLSDVDLYEDLWGKIRAIRNLKRHPYEFYQKMGYIITGVVPDANGIGKPDILMSKRVGE
ncbi:MAG: GNAT family N-acetyltransferase [Anaerolineales bacterium]|nr:GNAT family N-acetyltransferase [Anaerolineales bacterium]